MFSLSFYTVPKIGVYAEAGLDRVDYTIKGKDRNEAMQRACLIASNDGSAVYVS